MTQKTKTPMTITELIESANRPATEKQVQAFAARIEQREKEFERVYGPITNEFLNRRYTI